MIIDREKLDFVLAEQCKTARDLRTHLSPATIGKIRRGGEIGTRTAGRLARALDVPLDRLLASKACAFKQQGGI